VNSTAGDLLEIAIGPLGHVQPETLRWKPATSRQLRAGRRHCPNRRTWPHQDPAPAPRAQGMLAAAAGPAGPHRSKDHFAHEAVHVRTPLEHFSRKRRLSQSAYKPSMTASGTDRDARWAAIARGL